MSDEVVSTIDSLMDDLARLGGLLIGAEPFDAATTPAALQFNGSPFMTVPVEASPAEVGIADELDELATAGVDALRSLGFMTTTAACVTIRWQVAQKLHACTDFGDADHLNERARDLVDLCLLETSSRASIGARGAEDAVKRTVLGGVACQHSTARDEIFEGRNSSPPPTPPSAIVLASATITFRALARRREL